MQTNDVINGSIEFIGALFTWRNALQLWRDRSIKGVYWPAFVFFGLWGIWNIWFYGSLELWFSLLGSGCLVLGNVAWVALALAWRRS